ncbi:hypothetical protein [Arthrobacter sp. L77]|uniref:hypothetical protein n=1 Tax=Arthrobacter sp. L77 TaxID=1496689 RepID=UPI0005BC0336|nr:hypothetical protein [Arthrobacter sp. L77]
MGFFTKIQQYLGLEPAPVFDQYRKAERGAQLTCTRCGAFVAHESQTVHTDWHLALDSRA